MRNKQRTFNDLEKSIVHSNERPITEKPNPFGIKKKDNIIVNIDEYADSQAIKNIENFLNKCQRLLKWFK